ncbi:hypothetical protein AB0B30_38875 [Streptomyces narbonensis]|uniref:Uncharacterized protein n=1 Tax=Streptomyces narbonensis TaxID=67333 RepID=A0ABV3CNG8_9ACTN
MPITPVWRRRMPARGALEHVRGRQVRATDGAGGGLLAVTGAQEAPSPPQLRQGPRRRLAAAAHVTALTGERATALPVHCPCPCAARALLHCACTAALPG